MTIVTLQVVNLIICAICLLVDIFYVSRIRSMFQLEHGPNKLLNKGFTILSWMVSFGIILIPVYWVQYTYAITGVVAILFVLFGFKPMIQRMLS